MMKTFYLLCINTFGRRTAAPLLCLVFACVQASPAAAQNVGIGTTSPEARLHVRTTGWIKSIFENDAGQARGYIGTDNNGTLTLSSNAFWNGSAWVYPNSGNSLYLLLHQPNEAFEFRVRPDGGSQSTAMVVKVNGNVGIGTTNPQQQFSVAGGAVVDQGNTNTGTLAGSLRFGSNSGEAIGSKRNSGTGQFGLDFYTGNLQRMTIANNGNVGIGTNTPAARLDVNGDVNIGNRLLIGNTAGNNGQALISRGPGAAPDWENIAYSNNDRFFYWTDNDALSNVGDTIGYTTGYAFSSAITYSNKVFTVNKTGLYQLEGAMSARIVTTGSTVYPDAFIYLFFSGKPVVLMYDAFNYRGGSEWRKTMPFSTQLYLTAGTTFVIYFNANSSSGSGGIVSKQLQFSPLTINLISE